MCFICIQNCVEAALLREIEYKKTSFVQKIKNCLKNNFYRSKNNEYSMYY